MNPKKSVAFHNEALELAHFILNSISKFDVDQAVARAGVGAAWVQILKAGEIDRTDFMAIVKDLALEFPRRKLKE